MEVTAFNRLEQKIEEILTRLEAQRSQIADLSTQLSEKEKIINELEQQVETLNRERTDVRLRVDQLVQKLESSLSG